jgi:hypothetical protein
LQVFCPLRLDRRGRLGWLQGLTRLLLSGITLKAITITVEKDGYYEVNGARQEPIVSLYVIPAASKLRRMLKHTKDLIMCPGVYDGLFALIAMEVDFKGVYMAGISKLNILIFSADQLYRLAPELPRRGWEWRILLWHSFMI